MVLNSVPQWLSSAKHAAFAGLSVKLQVLYNEQSLLTMEKRLLDPDYQFKPPKPSAFWEWALGPLRRSVYRNMYGVKELEIPNPEKLHDAVKAGGGVMLAINHPAHGDPFVILEVMSRLRTKCCFLGAWQVFVGWMGLKGWAFQRLGAFSVDREGTDLRAFRTAVDVLVKGKRSLVIFPEGDVYHLNDRVTPLREGAATIAVTAARKRKRHNAPPLLIVPCAIKYYYQSDPTPELIALMAKLEEQIYWRPQVDKPLVDRIYRYSEAMIALKEFEYLQVLGDGSLSQRIDHLSKYILKQMEQRRNSKVSDSTIPERVKYLRHIIIEELGAGANRQDESQDGVTDEVLIQGQRDLEDLHLVTQLFSYPGDYLVENPSIERISETLDKFEEDALGKECAGARKPRKAVVRFGEPIDVTEYLAGSKSKVRDAAGVITNKIETGLQTLLDEAIS